MSGQVIAWGLWYPTVSIYLPLLTIVQRFPRWAVSSLQSLTVSSKIHLYQDSGVTQRGIFVGTSGFLSYCIIISGLLVGAFKHVVFSHWYMGCHPSHWLICFKMVKTTHQIKFRIDTKKTCSARASSAPMRPCGCRSLQHRKTLLSDASLVVSQSFGGNKEHDIVRFCWCRF